MPQRELLQERRRRAVVKRTPEAFAAPDDVDQSALVKRLEDRSRPDAPDLFDLGAADRLAVGDDRERLEGSRR